MRARARRHAEQGTPAVTIPAADTTVIAAQIALAPDLARLRDLLPEADLSPETVIAILDEAAKFSDRVLTPLNRVLDREGCHVENGRVRTASGHQQAWTDFAAAGWPSLDLPSAIGGQDMAMVMAAACQEIFDRGSIAFGMLTTNLRASVRLIAAHADAATKNEWLPRLVSGQWASTICISEPGAGSDAGRIRTRAVPNGDGSYAITGEKIWISYGDHDLAGRIGHCLLARIEGAPAGGAGLSLFLVPDWTADKGGARTRNAIALRRTEEKLGLHGSPTCALGFEGARGVLIGKEGRGLAQLFTMIAVMRLAVAAQGLALASGAADLALRYAEERRQGGPVNEPPVPIAAHADVQRQLLDMASRAEVLRGLVMALAVQVDLAAHEPDAEARANAQALSQWLLPVAKTLGGETAFGVASDAIQLFGGAGYVRDWPLEQSLRDARVFTIYEGTSGIQALDLLHRRLWRDEAKGLNVFLAKARADVERLHSACPGESCTLMRVLDLLADAGRRLTALAATPREAEAGATAFLQLAALAATGWIALRLASLRGENHASQRLAASGRYWLSDLAERATLAHAQSLLGNGRLEDFSRLSIK
ncbi:MAG: acyl-CoA dehydrogenase family protein [Alphaproteobacteria bacterium]|nr:acyl-CoA dehydrogenase family protein [Alphaproteobacteria bacterium]